MTARLRPHGSSARRTEKRDGAWSVYPREKIAVRGYVEVPGIPGDLAPAPLASRLFDEPRRCHGLTRGRQPDLELKLKR